MATTTYIAARLDGTVTTHTTRRALDAARARGRGGRTIVDSWTSTDPPPPSGASAAQWDAYRLRRGIASR